MTDLVWLVLLAVLGWYGWTALRAKELARVAGRLACERAAVQFLDDTVAFRRAWLRRDAGGRLRLWRRYVFEFTALGERRYHGAVTLSGTRVTEVWMEPYRF